MVRLANNNDFNKDTRHILMKIEIYLDGDNRPPLEIDKENYLINATILEETGADADWPLGLVSANELTFQLYSHHGLFCPTNVESPYYGKIKTRVKVRPYFKPADPDVVEWIPMGVYYVTDWLASITGIVASVVCHDIMRDIFQEKVANVPIMKDTTHKEFYEAIFSSLNVTADVSNTLNIPLPWAFTVENNARTIQELAACNLSICLSNREGVVVVKHLSELSGLKDILTDTNQVKEAKTEQRITRGHSGVLLEYSIPQLDLNAAVLSVQNLVAPPGTQWLDKMQFDQPLVYAVTGVRLQTSKSATVTEYKVQPRDISIQVENPNNNPLSCHLLVLGSTVGRPTTLLGEDNERVLRISNPYIQDSLSAWSYKALLEGFLSLDQPDVDILSRGNPLLTVGDLVQVQSAAFKLNYTGRIKRMYFKYDGALECEMSLLNNRIFEPIPKGGIGK